MIEKFFSEHHGNTMLSDEALYDCLSQIEDKINEIITVQNLLLTRLGLDVHKTVPKVIGEPRYTLVKTDIWKPL